jgi:hypothetical protein
MPFVNAGNDFNILVMAFIPPAEGNTKRSSRKLHSGLRQLVRNNLHKRDTDYTIQGYWLKDDSTLVLQDLYSDNLTTVEEGAFSSNPINATINRQGRLYLGGQLVTTDLNTVSAPFEGSTPDQIGLVQGVFFGQGIELLWVNQNFPNGTAVYCVENPHGDTPTLIAQFSGIWDCSYPAFLIPVLVISPTISPISTIPQTYFIPNTATISSESAIPSSVQLSQDGTCGPQSGFNNGPHTCQGFNGGQCCNSLTRSCRNDAESCGQLCLPGYGICGNVSVSLSSMSAASASSASVAAQPTTNPYNPFGKRGLVYVGNPLFPDDDTIWLNSNSPIYWYYNYKWEPNPAYQDLEYVPQLWGSVINSNFTSDVISLKNGVLNIQYALGFNEPDGPFDQGGSNMAPQQAASEWIQYMEPLRAHGIHLGAPAVTGSLRGIQWLQDFFTACAGMCHPTFVPCHVYGDLSVVQWLVTTMRGNYPNMTLWVTEFANPDQDLEDTVVSFEETFNWLDAQPYVDRYSYFGAFRSYTSNVGYNAAMLDPCGQLTDVGDLYLNEPLMHNVPGPHQCPYGLQDIGCNWSDGTYYTDPTTSKDFYIECYVDHFGGDDNALPGYGDQTTFLDCISFCANATGDACVDLSWANGPCYLKDDLNSATTDFNVWGAKATVAPSPSSSSSSASASLSMVSSTTTTNPLPSTISSGDLQPGVTSVSGWSYGGCLWDQPHGLTNDIFITSTMDQVQCISYASAHSYSAVGIESGSQCYLGNSIYNTASTTSDYLCSSLCVGNSGQFCGGDHVMNYFTRTNPSSSVSTIASCGISLNIPTPTPLAGMACVTEATENSFGQIMLDQEVELFSIQESMVYVEDSGVSTCLNLKL